VTITSAWRSILLPTPGTFRINASGVGKLAHGTYCKCPVTRDLWHDFLAVILRLEKPFGSFVETNQHLGSLLLPHRDHRFLQPPENKPWNYWLGAEEVGLSAAEVAAAWEITMNLNDVPLALNFIIFLSRVNWIGVFSGMICCSSGFGCRMV